MAYDIDEVLQAYVGYGKSVYPRELSEEVRKIVSTDEFDLAISHVNRIMNCLKSIPPDWNKNDLVEASRWAARQVGMSHPEIGHRGIEALIWSYSWWWK